MIAYNHYIQFIPELKCTKSLSGKYNDIITIQKSSLTNLPIEFNDRLEYINNQGRDLIFYCEGEFTKTYKEKLWAFEVKGVLIFYWNSGKNILSYIPQENFSEELLEYWSLHIILPMFFTIEETYAFIHAGAVEVKGKPILFIAESFGGKSTLTDFFIKKGHTMISDDKVATYEKNGCFLAISSHPHHRPHRKMEDLGFFVKNFSTQVKEIHVIYELERVSSDDNISIVELRGVEKFKSLRYASQMNLSFQKQKRFEYLMRMTEVVKVFKITVPNDLNRLTEVYDAIVKHSQNSAI